MSAIVYVSFLKKLATRSMKLNVLDLAKAGICANITKFRILNFLRLTYNEHSEGENGELFRRLNHSEIADFLAPTNVMLTSYRKRGSVTRILKYKTRIPPKRQFIE